ncbi:transposable element Tc1 transposase [Trichonephila clavipes]|nr:transposable element Tc1 transposase [Trichonephila clavipes]
MGILAGAHKQRNSSTVVRVGKQWIDEHRTARKVGSGRWKVTSMSDDRHLLRMAVNDRTASSRQLAAHESRFNLWDHDGRIRVRRCAGERCLPECVIERNNGLTTGVMVWGVISYHGRSNLLRIEGNLNSNRYVREVLSLSLSYSPKSFPSFKASMELSLSRIMHALTLQRLFETSVQPNTWNLFLGLLIRRICRLLSTCGVGFGWSASRS